MTTPEPAEASRARALRITAIVWLLVLSANTLINSAGFCHLKQTLNSVHNEQVKTATHIATVEQHVDTLVQKPLPLSQSRFSQVQQTTDNRLTHLEQEQNTKANTDDLQSLQNRFATLEARCAQMQPAQIAKKTPHHAMTATAVPLEPPFRIFAIELRVGVRFLSIAPPGTASLAAVRLLRQGDSDNGWHLDTLESHIAVFRVDGQSRRIPVPTETP